MCIIDIGVVIWPTNISRNIMEETISSYINCFILTNSSLIKIYIPLAWLILKEMESKNLILKKLLIIIVALEWSHHNYLNKRILIKVPFSYFLVKRITLIDIQGYFKYQISYQHCFKACHAKDHELFLIILLNYIRKNYI